MTWSWSCSLVHNVNDIAWPDCILASGSWFVLPQIYHDRLVLSSSSPCWLLPRGLPLLLVTATLDLHVMVISGCQEYGPPCYYNVCSNDRHLSKESFSGHHRSTIALLSCNRIQQTWWLNQVQFGGWGMDEGMRKGWGEDEGGACCPVWGKYQCERVNELFLLHTEGGIHHICCSITNSFCPELKWGLDGWAVRELNY